MYLIIKSFKISLIKVLKFFFIKIIIKPYLLIYNNILIKIK
jgi:hypothetical protein